MLTLLGPRATVLEMRRVELSRVTDAASLEPGVVDEGAKCGLSAGRGRGKEGAPGEEKVDRARLLPRR